MCKPHLVRDPVALAVENPGNDRAGMVGCELAQ